MFSKILFHLPPSLLQIFKMIIIILQYHDPKRGCYIQTLEVSKPKPYRIIAFDVETDQSKYANKKPNDNRRTHEPNFVAAKVACAECIASGKWKENLKNKPKCQVCGSLRSITFSHVPHKTDVDRQVICDNPLEAFVNWLLYQQEADYESLVFSHYGTFYDLYSFSL